MNEHRGRKLVLIRHSLPNFVLDVPASQWRLSEEGRRRCEKLAERLAAYDLAAVVASEEPKAFETGQIVADILNIPFQAAPGLHEHERPIVRSMGDREEFRALVASLFEHPDELVFGYETADEAHARFAHAVTDALKQHPSGNLAIATHGTVMTLFIARANNLDPIPFWRNLGLPAFAVLSLPDFDLLQTVDTIEQSPIA
jgi:broad specificity phosphatase PhoE